MGSNDPFSKPTENLHMEYESQPMSGSERRPTQKTIAGVTRLLLVLLLSSGCQSLSYDSDPPPRIASDPATPQEATPQKITEKPKAASKPATLNAPDIARWAPLTAQGREAMRARDFQAAQDAYTEALVQTESLSIHDARVRSALGNLLHVAAEYQRQGDWTSAEILINLVVEQSLIGRLADFDAAEPVFARQAKHYEQTNQPEAAAELMRIGLNLYGARAPHAVQRRIELESILGEAYLRMGLTTEAAPLLFSSLEAAQSRYGPKSVRAASALLPLAALYAERDEFEPAQRTNLQAIQIFEAQQPDSLALVRAYDQLARLHLDHDRAKEALPSARAAVEILDRNGHKSGILVLALDSLATAQSRTGEVAAADRNYQRAFADYKKLPVEAQQEDLILMLDHYAAFARSRNQETLAKKLSERAQKDRARVLVPADPKPASTDEASE